MQLGGYGEGREMVTANQLGMPPDESRAPGEGHQQNQGDRRQTLVGDPFSLSGSVAAFGAVAASMEEALLESPMRGEIHPAVVLLFPAVVAEAADDRSGKGLGRQPGDPKPFLIGRLGGQFSLPIAVALQDLLGADDADRLRVVERQGQGFAIPGIPELDTVSLVIPLLRPADVRRAMRKQAHGRWIQIATVLFEADDRLPAGPPQEIEDGALRLKGVQKEDGKEAAALKARPTRQQAKRRRVLAFAGPEPLQGQKRLDGAVNHLTADDAMIVLNWLDPTASLVLPHHPPFQAALTTAAETRPHLDPVQGGDPMALHPSHVKGFAAFQPAVHIDQHPLERFQVEAAPTVAQGVVPEGALGADPGWPIGVGPFGIPLLEAGKAEDQGVPQGQEDAGGRDCWIRARVRHLAGVKAQSETPC